MSKKRDLLALAVFFVLSAGANAVDVVSVLEVRLAETYVDSLKLNTGGITPQTVEFQDFGGRPGTVDSADFQTDSWPDDIHVYWRFDGIDQMPIEIIRPASDVWYELLPQGYRQDMSRIKFVDHTAIAEPETRPAMPRVTVEPNPFSHRTRLGFPLSRAGRVVVELYDATGRPVRTLADAELEPGQHHWSWDGTDDAGNRLAAGIYLARLVTGDVATIHKLILTN